MFTTEISSRKRDSFIEIGRLLIYNSSLFKHFSSFNSNFNLRVFPFVQIEICQHTIFEEKRTKLKTNSFLI